MRYVISDVHGEYELFVALLRKIRFSKEDEMLVGGDMIDKGKSSVRLLKLIFSLPNVKPIIGNHEYAFLKYYHGLMQTIPYNPDDILRKLQEYFPDDGHLLDWDTVDALEALPTYIEEDDFLLVHAGVPINDDGELLPPRLATTEQLVHDRRFKAPELVHRDKRCVFFGHTETTALIGRPRMIAYKRTPSPTRVNDYYKIHLDTGAWSRGVLGCFCIDTLKPFYVERADIKA